MADIEALTNWCDGFLAKLAPAARRQLAGELAKRLRQSQQQRIAAQRNPDGSGFIPRKAQLRGRKGSIKRRAMFSKLRTNRYLQAKGTANNATVAFVGRVQHVAQVHQYGLKDIIRNKGRIGPEYQYPARHLLGFSDSDIDLVETLILEHLSR